MRRMIPLIEGFILDKILSSNSIVSNRSKAGIILLGLSLISMIGALILSIIAAYYWLSLRYSPDVAAFAAAMMVLFLSGLFGLSGYLLLQRRKSRLHKAQEDITDGILDMLEAVSDELDLPVKIQDHPKTAMALATVLGFIVAERVL